MPGNLRFLQSERQRAVEKFLNFGHQRIVAKIFEMGPFLKGNLMAQYEHLPIYKKAYDLTLYFDKIVRSFSRYHKYQIGAELRELSREVLRLIRRANDATDKAPLLLQNRERLEDLKMTVRCNGFGKISFFRSFFCFILNH